MEVISAQTIPALEALKNLYKRKRLTQCLTFLGDRGIEGDLAIFVLSNLNRGGK